MNNQSPLIPQPRPSEPSALDLAIHRFEQQARKYHYNKSQAAPANETAEQKAARQKAFERDWDHLQKEKIRISTLAALQQNLEEYREDSKNKTTAELVKEPHHPTRKLANNLTAIAEPKPSPDHDPHHIIMGKGRWLVAQMMRARLNLHAHGIGINDPINGIWLPRNNKDAGHWATPGAPAHKKIHRYNYEQWVTRILRARGLSEVVVRNQLRDIKHKLKTGTYPIEITLPKDTEWEG